MPPTYAYGDLIRTECPWEKLGGIAGMLWRLAGMLAGIERHGALVAALIEASELAQGIADARFTEAGERDARWPDAEAAMALLARIAQAVRLSWESGFARLGPVPEAAVAVLHAARLPGTPRTKRAEGFALYSLYPEGYVQAAAAALGDVGGAPLRVIGIRSIGAPLAALVAAATGAPPPLTGAPGRPLLSPPAGRGGGSAGGTAVRAGDALSPWRMRDRACPAAPSARSGISWTTLHRAGADPFLPEPSWRAGTTGESPPP